MVTPARCPVKSAPAALLSQRLQDVAAVAAWQMLRAVSLAVDAERLRAMCYVLRAAC